jgi:hypothetical protein
MEYLLEPPYTDPYVRWCGRGRRATAAPMPIIGGYQGVGPYAGIARGLPRRKRAILLESDELKSSRV